MDVLINLAHMWFFFEVHSLFMNIPMSNPPERLYTEPTFVWFFFEMNGLFMHASLSRAGCYDKTSLTPVVESLVTEPAVA